MIYVWVRSTVDWEDEQALIDQAPPEFLAKIAMWNETFNVPFHIFRHRVREIARLNLSRIQHAVCAPWEEIPDGTLVLPVDDDDWFAPDVAAVLKREMRSDIAGYRWTSSFLEVPIHARHALGLLRRRLFPRTRPKYICTTNNYALFKGPDTRRLLGNHVGASRWFAAQPAERVKTIDARLSAMNRTLASQTSLRHDKETVARSELVRKYRRYRELYRAPIPLGLEWCRPYLAMMDELMGELGVKEPRRRRGGRETR